MLRRWSEETMFTDSECQRCRHDFPALGREHQGQPVAYLDGPAGTQVPEAVIEAVSGYYRICNSNTHGAFAASRESDEIVHATRETVAAFLGAQSWRQISFGQNMTTLTYSLSKALVRQMEPGDEVVITALDHEGNRDPWLGLAEHGIVIREVGVTTGGEIDMEDLAAKVGDRTRLVAMGLASNALGTVNDVERARQLTRASGALLLVDAVHHAAHFPIDVTALDTDFLLCSAYKFYGPHVGILCTRMGFLDRLPTDRLSFQESDAPWRIETGTLNHAAIAGVKAAIEYIASWGDGVDLRQRIISAMTGIAAYEHGLARRYYEGVQSIAGARAWGPGFESPKRCPTVTITTDRTAAPEVARGLGERGIQVWHGHFGAPRPIEALDLATYGGPLRTGIVMYNTAAEVDRLLAGIAEITGA
jgi:cysteine desulfurase family protein (TIGR01976 family)